MSDTYNLERFVQAQQNIFSRVLQELREGQKRTHWMWFIFPQIQGLGHSEMAQKYAIGSLDEARAYIHHPELGPRLQECTQIVVGIEGRSPHQIFGSPDDMKFHSSMTLFAHAAPEHAIFGKALSRFFGGTADPKTVERL